MIWWPETQSVSSCDLRSVLASVSLPTFCNRRLLEPIGNLPPAEAEAAYYAQLEVTGIAA